VSYLIDTNVISELSRPQPNSRVVGWFQAVPDEALHISVLTLGELRKGVELAADKKRKEKLRVWLEQDVKEWFGNRLVPLTEPVAENWGRLLAQIGRPVPAIDSLLAATALHFGLRIVTRNTADFVYPGLEVINPWLNLS
jgi:predicted nucleic acid-binding protein